MIANEDMRFCGPGRMLDCERKAFCVLGRTVPFGGGGGRAESPHLDHEVVVYLNVRWIDIELVVHENMKFCGPGRMVGHVWESVFSICSGIVRSL